jgi:hypothetical protein
MALTPFYRVTVVLLFALFGAPTASNAQELTQSVGQARLEYASSNQGVYREVFHLAKINALQRVVLATFPEAKVRLFNKYEAELTSFESIDRYVIDASEMAPAEDTALSQPRGQNDKSIRLSVRATISITALDAFFQSQSSAGSLVTGEVSEFGVLFFGRRIEARQNFDTRQVTVSERDATESVQTTIGEDGTTTLEGVTTSSTSRSASGGSATDQRANDTYVANTALSQDLGAAIKEELVDAGFEPIEVEDIAEDYDLLFLDELVDEGLIREDGTLPRRTLNEYKKAALAEGWRFFGFGRVDVGLPQLDSRGTGIMQIPATVTFEVFMDVDGRARTVAIVAPETLWGDDPNGDVSVAEQRAYRAAVEKAMETVVAQLQAADLY